MRIVHIPFSYHPDKMGGTEVYVQALVKRLLERGAEAVIAAPGEKTESYTHEGIQVYRFAFDHGLGDMKDFYGVGSKKAGSEFGLLLDEIKPDIVHLHAFTHAVCLRLVQLAKNRGMKVFFTYHTPSVSCQQSTLIRWTKSVCDGKLKTHLCSSCTLHGLGLKKPVAILVGMLPSCVGGIIIKLGLKSRLWTALSMTFLMTLRHKAIRDLMANADVIIAVSEWVRAVIMNLGVPADKIYLSRQGLCQTPNKSPAGQAIAHDSFEGFTKCAFFGRYHPIKGIHLLMEAFRRSPHLKIRLDIYGAAFDDTGIVYEKKINRLAQNDPRISFKSLIPSVQVPEVLARYDYLLVPSEMLETGPLVVLEAFSAGVPPICPKDRGSFSEVISDDIDGLLIETNSIDEWVRILERVTNDPALASRLKNGIKAPRTMDTVADEMMSLYQKAQ